MKRKSIDKRPLHTLPSNVMTVREVSAYLQVHPSTIYRLLKQHQIPAFQMGSDWRFNIEAIDDWGRAGRERPGAAERLLWAFAYQIQGEPAGPV